jgi:hypothetical protein
MKYVLLIHQYRENDPENPPEPEYLAHCLKPYEESLRDGVLVASEPLQKSANTTVVRVREGKVLTTDGPYMESKEQVSGFYLLDCETLEQAVKYAAMIPGASECAVEVRPVMQFAYPDGFPKEQAPREDAKT